MHPFSAQGFFVGPGAALEVLQDLTTFSRAYYLYACTLSQTVNRRSVVIWESEERERFMYPKSSLNELRSPPG